MAEKFLESEDNFEEKNSTGDEDNESMNNKGKWKKLKIKKNSTPVNIPENMSANSWSRYMDSDFFDDEDGDYGEMVPPHDIIGRRLAGKMMSFSVCTGNGRTLKGRDLSQVRNSILRMTGFLEK
ncbi:uncharacterized protein Fot_45681 [Forsythia ovata]|uniref:Senescence regulator n=1 Tax=Forsythia ovata TaxID=205694 RepID=A0ABD1R855_9LAMI